MEKEQESLSTQTCAFNQIFRSLLKLAPASPPLWFWRTREGHEIDFIIEKGGTFTAIAAKLKELPDEGDISAILKLKSITGENNFKKGHVICPTENAFPVSRKIRAVDGVGT